MASIICCACVFANPTYLATPAQNYLRIEPKVRSTAYRILLMALFTAVSRLVRGLVLLRLVHDADQRIFLVGTSPYQACCVASLNIKNLISPTLLNCVLKAFALALKDSTEAFVSLSSK